MIALNHYQLYQLQGPQVKEFLQGQVCSDMNALQEGSSQLTGICNAKGRLVASPYVLLKNNTYYLAISKDMAEILFKYWRPYLMISRIQTVCCDNLKAYGMIEPSHITTDFIVNLAGNTTAQIIFSEKPLNTDNTTSDIDWYNEMVQSGVVTIQPETSKIFMPTTLGYSKFHALSFNKGCYVGQEILARIHYKGTVKKEVCAVKFNPLTAIKANETIIDENNKPIGQLAIAPDFPVDRSLSIVTLSVPHNTHYYLQTNPSIKLTLHANGAAQ